MKDYTLREFSLIVSPFLETETFEQFEKRLNMVPNSQKHFLNALRNNPIWFGAAFRTMDDDGNFHVFFHYHDLPLKPWEQDKPANISLKMLDFNTKPVVQVTTYHRVK